MAVIITVAPTNGVGEEQNAATSEPSRPYQIEGNRGLVPLMRAMFPCWFRMLGPNHPFMERVRCKGVDSLKVSQQGWSGAPLPVHYLYHRCGEVRRPGRGGEIGEGR